MSHRPVETRDHSKATLLPSPVSVVVTNYNGRGNLEKYLPRVIEALDGTPRNEFVVVDDGSTDDSVAWLRANLPEVRVVALETNRGFPVAANAGFHTATHPYVFLLSSDMVPIRDTLPLLFRALLSRDDIFCAGGRQVLPDGAHYRGRWAGGFRKGVIRLLDHPEQPSGAGDEFYYQFQTAIGLYRKELFVRVDGFCELFCPFYFEDVDLGYRAWKCGYPIVYEPRARIVHHHEDSSIFGAYEKRFRKSQHRIHQYYMFWKNVDQRAWLARHALWLTLRLPFSWLWGDWALYRACLGYFRHREAIGNKRRTLRAKAKYTDDEVIRMSGRTVRLEASGPRDPEEQD